MSNFDHICAQLANLTDDELRQLQGIVGGMIADRTGTGPGYVERRTIKKRLKDGTVREYGPYLYGKERRDGKIYSVYLGKEPDAQPTHNPTSRTHHSLIQMTHNHWPITNPRTVGNCRPTRAT